MDELCWVGMSDQSVTVLKARQNYVALVLFLTLGVNDILDGDGQAVQWAPLVGGNLVQGAGLLKDKSRVEIGPGADGGVALGNAVQQGLGVDLDGESAGAEAGADGRGREEVERRFSHGYGGPSFPPLDTSLSEIKTWDNRAASEAWYEHEGPQVMSPARGGDIYRLLNPSGVGTC